MTSTELSNASKVMLGSTEASAMYIGSTLIWQQSSSSLPFGYTKLQYISSTGTQYIDLGCTLSDTTDLVTIWTKFNIKNNVGNNAAVMINSTRQSDPWPGWLICLNNNAANIQIYRGKVNNQGSFQAVPRQTVYETSDSGLVIGSMQSGYTHNFSTTLFCLKDISGNYLQYAVADMYYLKIQKGNTIIKDLIPCIDPNNVVGLYDLVSRTFYSSPNGAAFVAGPTV